VVIRSYNIADCLTSTYCSRGCFAGPWCKASIADHAEGFKIVDHNSKLAHPVIERGTSECNVLLRISGLYLLQLHGGTQHVLFAL